jgi:excisionase family DNA binding protein
MTTNPPPGPRLPRLFTIAEVAEYLGISQRTVRRMIKTRVLPVIRIGRSMRVSESALLRLVTS